MNELAVFPQRALPLQNLLIFQRAAAVEDAAEAPQGEEDLPRQPGLARVPRTIS